MNQENNGFNPNDNQNQDYMNNNYNQNNGFEQNYNQNQSMNYHEENNEKEPKKNSNILLIIFMIISLCLAGFIIYDKVLKKEEVKEPEKPVEIKQPEEIKVVDAYNSQDGVLVVPKLTGSSQNVINFNKKIENKIIESAKVMKAEFLSQEFLDEYELSKPFISDYEINDFSSIHKFITESLNSIVAKYIDNVGYDSYIKNDVIAINFRNLYFNNAGTAPFSWYFYDIKNDREISLNEAAKSFGATLNGGKIVDYNNLPESCFDIIITENPDMDMDIETGNAC